MKASNKSTFSATAYRAYLKRYTSGLSEENKQRLVVSLYIIFTLFTVSFFGIFAINPTITTISNLQKQYEDSQAVDRALQEKLDALQKLDFQYAQLQNDLFYVFDAIPESSQIPLLTRQLETLAALHGLSVVRLDIRSIELYPGQKGADSIFSYFFNMGLTGPENNITAFIADLTTISRMINLSNVTTDRTQTGSGASVTGRAYFLKQ